MSPTTVPGVSPTTSPGASPTTSPGASPTTSPGASPTTSPGVSPTTSPGDDVFHLFLPVADERVVVVDEDMVEQSMNLSQRCSADAVGEEK